MAPVGASGASGSGGGGALLLASSTQISVNGSITANGGVAAFCTFGQRQQTSGAGSGGAIRLVAPTITGAGALAATGGLQCPPFGGGGAPIFAGDGRIRLEAFTLGGRREQVVRAWRSGCRVAVAVAAPRGHTGQEARNNGGSHGRSPSKNSTSRPVCWILASYVRACT